MATVCSGLKSLQQVQLRTFRKLLTEISGVSSVAPSMHVDVTPALSGNLARIRLSLKVKAADADLSVLAA